MDPELAAEKLADLAQRTAQHRKRHYARQPKQITDVVAQLFARKGYAATRSNEQLVSAWSEAVGAAMAKLSRPTVVRRGKLEVLVANSLMMQELGFDRARLLAAMQQALPDARIEELRFKVGKI